MSWGRVDDKLVEHPKWVRLEREFGGRTWADALAIWTWVLCYTSRNETDGGIDATVLARATPIGRAAVKAADAMVAVGLMDRAGPLYVLHDFTNYNPSRAQLQAKRQADSLRKKVKGAEESEWNPSGIQPEAERIPEPPAGARAPDPVPARPLPSQQRSDPPDGGSASAADARASSVVVSGAGADLSARAERARLVLTEAYRSRGLVVPVRSLSVPHSQEVLDIARTFAEPADLARAIDGFFSDARAKTAGFELRWLAARPNQYTGQARDGGRQPRPHAEYRDTPMMSFGELMRGGDAAKGGDHG